MAEKNKRNLTKMVLLGFVTLGIYWYYWIYKVTGLSNRVTTLPERSPVAQLLLCLLVPFYEIYWYYQTSKRVDVMMQSAGQTSDSGVATLLLTVFGGPLAVSLFLQDKINTVLGVRTGEKAPGSVGGALALGIVLILLLGIVGFAAEQVVGNFLEDSGFSEQFGSLFDGDFDEFLEEDENGDLILEDNETVKKTNNGRWALMKGDMVDTDFTGVAENENGLWYIVDGYVDFEFSGTLEADDGTVYTIENGKVVDQQKDAA